MSSVPSSPALCLSGRTVLILGGGLAALATAAALAPRGFQVTILEARPRLGGRASSFVDPTTGQLVDMCQHVSMGCCTNLDHFCRTAGIDHFLEPQPCLFFMTPDRRVSRFRGDPLPAPLHLARSFLGLHFLSLADKLRIARALDRLKRADPDDDVPFGDWLRQHRQSQRAIDRFWGLVLISALNEAPDRCGLRYARKVFVDGFLGHRRGFEVQVPSVPLGQLYGTELEQWLGRNRVELRTNRAAKSIRTEADRVTSVETREGEALRADWYVAAVPSARLLDLLPAETVHTHPSFAGLRQLEASPITSVHLWFDRPLLKLPHVVLVDCVGQWLFNRGEVAPGQWYVQVVVSAARQFRGLGRDEIEHRIVAEVSRLFPGPARLQRARVVTEHAATFSAVPGVDQWRPGAGSPIANLLLAGDWTATGWPATMEGAVRSGYRAAEVLLERVGRPERLVQPELSAAW